MSLFSPIRVGALDLPNRIVMAPMTRSRAIGKQGVGQQVIVCVFFLKMQAAQFRADHQYARFVRTKAVGQFYGVESRIAPHEVDAYPLYLRAQAEALHQVDIQTGCV